MTSFTLFSFMEWRHTCCLNFLNDFRHIQEMMPYMVFRLWNDFIHSAYIHEMMPYTLFTFMKWCHTPCFHSWKKKNCHAPCSIREMMSYTCAHCAHVWYEAIKIVLIREVGVLPSTKWQNNTHWFKKWFDVKTHCLHWCKSWQKPTHRKRNN